MSEKNPELPRRNLGVFKGKLWADLLDCEAFEREVYERRHRFRRPVDLDPPDQE